MPFQDPHFTINSQLPQTWDLVLEDTDNYTSSFGDTDVRVMFNLKRFRTYINDICVDNAVLLNALNKIVGFLEGVRSYRDLNQSPTNDDLPGGINFAAYKDGVLMSVIDLAEAEYVLLEVPMQRKNHIYSAFTTAVVYMVSTLPLAVLFDTLVERPGFHYGWGGRKTRESLHKHFHTLDIHITGLRFSELIDPASREEQQKYLKSATCMYIPLGREYQVALEPEWSRFIKIAAYTKVHDLIKLLSDKPACKPAWYIGLLWSSFSEHFGLSNEGVPTPSAPEDTDLLEAAKAEVQEFIDHLDWQLANFKQVINHPLGSMVRRRK